MSSSLATVPSSVQDGNSIPNPPATNQSTNNALPSTPKSLRYWVVIFGLSLVALLPALEGTVISTALPSIVADLQGGQLFVWVVNAYFLASTAVQPLFGQLSNIFGRRTLILSTIALFIVGSGVSGGAGNPTTLIAGRTVQGLGGGGVTMLVDLIVCDMVPIRERGSVMGIVIAAATIGTALGPTIGGLMVDRVSWRWAFYINIPIAAAAGLVLAVFFRTKPMPRTTIRQKLDELDVIGNAIFIPSVTAVLIALANSGAVYPWSSWHTIVPLLLGFLGLGTFIGFEWSPFCRAAMMPKQLFSNRTSTVAFVLTFLHTLLMNWEVYFVPVYLQGVLGSSPVRSGVQLLPTVLPLMVFAVVGGGGMQATGKYKPFHFAGFALMSIGLGLFSMLKSTSATAEWVIFQLIFSSGTGLGIGTLLPAAQAGLPEEAAALSTGFWAFSRSCGTVWGIGISSAIFDARMEIASSRLSSPGLRAKLGSGDAYQHATGAFIDSLTNADAREVKGAFSQSLRVMWFAALAFALVSFLLVFVERQIVLRTELDTKFGLAENEKEGSRIAEHTRVEANETSLGEDESVAKP